MEPVEAMRVAEPAEAGFMEALALAAPRGVRAALGMAHARVGGGVVLVMTRDPTGGYWSKALGFGVEEPFTADVAHQVLEVYRAHEAPVATLQVAPHALPPDWDDVCAREGLVRGSTWVKLLRDPSPAAPAQTELRVGPVGPGDAARWAEVLLRGFGMPLGPLADMVAAVVRPGSGFDAYAAWDGEELVASATLFVRGAVAAFSGAATLPEHRGRGAQSAFFAARVERARALGCTHLSAETWKPENGQHNPSLSNMERAGFDVVYDRTNWTWHR